MSKDILSQGEIDALLKTIEDTGGERFSNTEKEALIELTNLGVEASVGAFSTLTNREFEAERPEISVNRRSIVEKTIVPGSVCLSVLFEGGVGGQAMVAIDGGLAAVLCDILLGGDGTSPPAELGETHLATFKEAYQHGLDATAAALSETLGDKLRLTAGAVTVASGQEEVAYFGDFDPDHVFVELTGKLGLPDMVEGEARYLYPSDLSRAELKLLTARQTGDTGDSGPALDEGEDGVPADEADLDGADEAPEDEAGDSQSPAPVAAPPAARTKAPAGAPQGGRKAPPVGRAQGRVVGGSSRVQVQSAAFETLKPTTAVSDSQNLDLILDVPLHLTVELGRTRMQVRQVLALGTGAVIELEKLAGEPLDVMVNGRLIAKGEVVIINENFGVRITDVVSQVERVQNLR